MIDSCKSTVKSQRPCSTPRPPHIQLVKETTANIVSRLTSPKLRLAPYKNPTPLEKFIWNHKIDYFKVKDKAVCSYTAVSIGDPHIVLVGITNCSLNLLPPRKHLACWWHSLHARKNLFYPGQIMSESSRLMSTWLNWYYTFFLILRCLQWPRSDRISSRCSYWS